MADGSDPRAGDDLRTALSSALASSEKSQADNAAAEEAERVARKPADEPVEAESTEPAADEIEPRETRARGPDGKFIPKEELADKTIPDKPIEAKATEEKPEATKTNEPPVNWSAADKAAFKSLPAPAQQMLLRRHGEMEADYTRKTQEIAAFRKDYEPIEQLFTPYKDLMRQKGFTPSSLVQAWFNVEKALQEGKGVEIVKGLVEGYKLDTAKVAAALGVKGTAELVAPPNSAKPVENGHAAPQPLQLPPEIDKRFQTIEQRFQAEDQQRANAERQRLADTLSGFQNQKNDKGDLVHPHFSELENDMVLLVEGAKASGRAIPPLEDLYNTAVWANPSTRAKILDQQRAAEEAQRTASEKKRQEEVRAKAAAARKASSSVTGAPGSGQPPRGRESERGLRDELNANYEDINA